MPRTSLLAAAAVLCLALGSGCSGGGNEETESDITDDLSAQLQERDGFDADEADCYAEIVVDEVGADNAKDLEVNDSEPPEELEEELAAATLRARDECDLDELG